MTTNNNKLSIKEVAQKYELSEVYVRRMILKGVIPTEKILIAKNTYKHLIDENWIIEWRKRTASKGRTRKDGRNKYTLYGTKEEIEQIQNLLAENKVESILQRTNKVKTTNDK